MILFSNNIIIAVLLFECIWNIFITLKLLIVLGLLWCFLKKTLSNGFLLKLLLLNCFIISTMNEFHHCFYFGIWVLMVLDWLLLIDLYECIPFFFNFFLDLLIFLTTIKISFPDICVTLSWGFNASLQSNTLWFTFDFNTCYQIIPILYILNSYCYYYCGGCFNDNKNISSYFNWVHFDLEEVHTNLLKIHSF